MYTAGGSIKQLRKHSALLVKEPEVSFEDTLVSQETRSKAAGISGLEGADEEVICVLGDDVVLSVRASEITTKGWVDKLFCALVASHDSSSEYLASSLSLALKNPLPEDAEPFSEDVFILSPALNSALPIRTEFDADDNKGLEAPQDVVIAKSPDSPVSTEGIFTAAKLIKPLCKGCAVLAKNQEISPTNALVSWKVVYGGAGADGRGDGDGLVDELEDRVKVSSRTLEINNKSNTNKLFFPHRLLNPRLSLLTSVLKIEPAIYPSQSKYPSPKVSKPVLRMPHSHSLFLSTPLSLSIPDSVLNITLGPQKLRLLWKPAVTINPSLKHHKVSLSQGLRVVIFQSEYWRMGLEMDAWKVVRMRALGVNRNSQKKSALIANSRISGNPAQQQKSPQSLPKQHLAPKLLS